MITIMIPRDITTLCDTEIRRDTEARVAVLVFTPMMNTTSKSQNSQDMTTLRGIERFQNPEEGLGSTMACLGSSAKNPTSLRFRFRKIGVTKSPTTVHLRTITMEVIAGGQNLVMMSRELPRPHPRTMTLIGGKNSGRKINLVTIRILLTHLILLTPVITPMIHRIRINTGNNLPSPVSSESGKIEIRRNRTDTKSRSRPYTTACTRKRGF